MAILNDKEIMERSIGYKPMIAPFNTTSVRRDGADNGILSYGLSSFGYDVRLDRKFRIFTNLNGTVIDPKRLDERCLVDVDPIKDEYGSEYVILPPNSYLLGVTMEYFRIPRDVMVLCVGKSTYARASVAVNVTPIEAGFEGNVVIEVCNLSSLPVKIYANEGIAQFLFFEGNPCQISYADRDGKYQGQTGIQLSKV